MILGKRVALTTVVGFMIVAIVSTWAGGQAAGPADAPRAKSRPSATTSAPASQPAGATLDKSIDLWLQGKNAEAVAAFLAINWKPGQATDKGSLLALKEEDFLKLSHAQQEKEFGQLSELYKPWRELDRHILGLAKDAFEAKDYATAERYLLASLDCGRYFMDDSKLCEITRMVGRAIKGSTLTKMISLYEAIPDQAKLDKARKELGDMPTASQLSAPR